MFEPIEENSSTLRGARCINTGEYPFSVVSGGKIHSDSKTITESFDIRKSYFSRKQEFHPRPP
jgi:hypothetical protein